MPTDAHQALCGKMMLPTSERLARLWELVVPDEQDAQLLVNMPADAAALAAATGLDAAEVERRTAELFHRGVVFKKPRPDGVEYRAPRHLIQFHDASVQWAEAPAEYFAEWKLFMAGEYRDWLRMVLGAGMPSFMRTLPAAGLLEGRADLLPEEDVIHMVESAERLAVCKCPCRTTEGKCDTPLETCIQFNRGADYNIERGTGREIDTAEALKIVRDSAANGQVHTVENRAGLGNVLCNCCSCCCAIIVPFREDEALRTILAPSRYQARVVADTCVGDCLCESVCPTGAIKVDDRTDKAQVDATLCIGCGLCAQECPTGAVALERVRAADFIPA